MLVPARNREAQIARDGAEGQADKLTQRYGAGQKAHFYGDIYPVEQKYKEARVIARIEPQHVALDAVFK